MYDNVLIFETVIATKLGVSKVLSRILCLKLGESAI